MRNIIVLGIAVVVAVVLYVAAWLIGAWASRL